MVFQSSQVAFAIFLAVSLGTPALAAESPAWEEFESSVSKIRSFDVTLKTSKTFLRKAAPADVSLDSIQSLLHPVDTYFVEYGDGEQPPPIVSESRQIWEKTGRRRIEAEHQNRLKVFDGELVAILDIRQLEGAILAALPDQKPLLEPEKRYDVLFSEVLFGGTYSELVRRRVPTRIEDSESGVSVMIPVKREDFYPEYAFEFVLDPDHGFLPKRIAVDLRGRRFMSTEITAFKKVSNGGVWVPIEAIHQFFDVDNNSEPVVIAESKLSVDLDKSTWNEPIPESRFVLNFPAGTRIRDEVLGAVRIVGDTDIAANLDSLAAKAKTVAKIDDNMQMKPVNTSFPLQRTSFLRSGLVVLNGVLLLAIGFMLFLRFYRGRSS